jgi:HK97 family phage portal protein
MGLFKNAKELVSKYITTNTPVGNQEVGLARLGTSNIEDKGREAVFPQWFFSSRLGQPRQVDTQKIRKFAQSAWVQMVLNTFKKQVYNTEWDIIAEDENDETDRTEDIKKIKQFLNNINQNGQTIDDINSETITDIAEIDGGAWNLIYSSNSYDIGEVPLYDAWGRVIGSETGVILKPLGQRELVAVKSVDGATMLKQIDMYKNLLNYWQYSFKHPRQNPTRFEKDEIVYHIMNNRPYSVYGFSPVQAIQQVLELLIQGTRYNKDLYTNNAIPDLVVSMPKIPPEDLKKIKRKWYENYKGRPHPVAFINWAIEAFHKLNDTNRDLEWLDGQKWYFKIVFAVFGVSPTEAGFFENSNRSNDEGQERVTVRNAVKPYFKKFEQSITRRLITEILQTEDHGLKFVYKAKDHTLEKIEFEQDIQELDHGTLTINEFRIKKGREPVEWGDDPLRRPFDPATSFTNFGDFGGNPNQNNPNSKDNNKPKLEDMNEDEKKALKSELYKKGIEGFLNDSKQSANSR